MPNTPGAKKRLRQNVVRRNRNRTAKSKLKTAIRKFREAVTAEKWDEAVELRRSTGKALDQAASKRVIHARKAARLKSRLSSHLKKAQASTSS